MFGFIRNWYIASKIGAFTHAFALDKREPISQDACHAMVKAYGWGDAVEMLSFNQNMMGTFEAFKITVLCIAQDVYGNRKGSNYAQAAAM